MQQLQGYVAGRTVLYTTAPATAVLGWHVRVNVLCMASYAATRRTSKIDWSRIAFHTFIPMHCIYKVSLSKGHMPLAVFLED